MKYFGAALTILILVFWSTMNSLLIRRQIEEQKLDLYQRKVNRFLEAAGQRERWLGIYKSTERHRRKIGYTGTILGVRQGPDGTEYVTEIDSAIDMEIFGQGAVLLRGLLGSGYLEIKGSLVQDPEMRPIQLAVDLTFPNQTHIRIQGERREDRFILKAFHEKFSIPPLSMPLEKLALGNSVVPDLPVAGLKEGESFQVKTFDPVFFTSRPVDVKVVSLDTQEIDGLLVDVYTLESTFRGFTSTTLITRDGTVLRMKLGPPFEGITLRHETAETAKRSLPGRRPPPADNQTTKQKTGNARESGPR